jgi:hypothetical protein
MLLRFPSPKILTAALFAVCLLPVTCNAIPLLRGGVFSAYEDALGFALARFCFASDAFSRGDTLQWFPAAACGVSSSGEGAGGFLLPTVQIFCRLFSGPVAYQLDVIACQLTAFLSMLVLLRQRQFSWRICAVGAGFYAFCPMGLATRTSMNWVFAAMPLLLAGIEKVAISDCLGHCALLASAVLLVLLSGHPPLVAYAALIAVCHVAYCSTTRDSDWLTKLKFAGKCAFSAIAAGVLSLPLWIPVVRQVGLSDRIVNSADIEALQNTVHLLPSWFSVFLKPFYSPWYTEDHWQESLRLPVMVLVFAILPVSTECRKNQVYQLGMLTLILLIAAGPLTPLWKLVHSLPVLKYFRFPFRWLFFLPLFVTPLAARGVQSLLCRRGTLQPRLTTALGLALLAVAWQFRWLSTTDEVRWIALASTLGMAVATLLLSFDRLRSSAVASGIACSAIYMLGWGVAHQLDPAAFIRVPTADQRIQTDCQNYRVCLAQQWYRPWSQHPVAATAVPDLPAATGLRSAQYSGSNIPYWSIQVQDQLWKFFEGDDSLEGFAQICAIRYVYSQTPLRSNKLRLLEKLQEGTYLYELIAPLPRARMVSSGHDGLTDMDVLAILKKSPDLHNTVLISDDATVLVNRDLRQSPLGGPGVRITAESNGLVELKADRPITEPTWLVLADTWYPGWRCYVDGVEVPIRRANYSNRAVLLPPGAVKATFQFVPMLPDWLQTVPSIALCGLLVLSAVYARRIVPDIKP